MSVPPPAVPASLSTSGYEDGLGLRTLMFDRETGGILERLHLRPEFAAFGAAIRQRMELGAVFEDERFAHPRAAERDPHTGGLVIVSEFVPGNRLSDILENLVGDGAEESTPPGVDAALGFLLEILPALTTLHASTGFTHGAVAPGRVVVTPAGQVVLLDWLFGHTLERLKLDRRRLWRQFGIAMPPGAGASRFDAGADVAQAALTAVMIVIGRPLRDSEFPDGLAAAAAEVVEIAQISGSARFATGLQRFLHRALPLPVSRLFPTAEEADAAVRQLAAEIGVSRCRAALASFVSDFNRMNESAWREREPERLAESIDRFSDAEEPHALAPDDRETTRSVSAALEFEIELDSVTEPDVHSRDEHEVETVPYEISLESSLAEEPVIDAPAVEEDPTPFADSSYGGQSVDETPLENVASPETAPAEESFEEVAPSPEFFAEAAPAAASVDTTETAEPYSENAYHPADPPLAPADFEEPAADTSVEAATSEPDEWAQPAVIEEPVPARALVEDPPAAIPAASPAKATPRQRRRGAKRDRDKLRSNAKPSPAAAPAVVPVPTPAPVPVPVPLAAPAAIPVPTFVPAPPAPPPAMRQPAPPMPYYPPMFDPREPAAPPAAAWTFAAPAPPVPAAPPAPIRVKQAPAPVAVRVRNDAPSGYAPPPRRTAFPDPADGAAVPHVNRGGRPRLSPLQWKLAGAAALILAVGAGAVARPYLVDRPQPQAAATVAAPRAVPKPAAAGAGSIALVTQPAGAKVLLDGTPAGETPVTLDSVAPGRHTITFVTAAGTLKKNIRVEAGKTTSLDVPVYSGWVAVFAPVLLDIAENGRSIGTTEQGRLMLSPGRHQLTFSNRELGYSFSQAVDIEPGEERSVNVQPTGELNLNALPWAEVWIDGQKAGDTPIANLKVPLGTHEITFKHPQFGDRKMTTTIRANAPASASVDFTKPPQQ